MKITKPLIVSIALCAASTAPLCAQVLYSENFGAIIAPAGNYPINNPPNLDWTGYIGATAAPTADVASAPRWGKPHGVGAVADGTGLIFGQSDPSNLILAAHTNTTLSLNPASITEVNWLMGNSATTVQVRLMIQQSGNWYATDSTFTTAAMSLTQFQANPTSTAELKTFTFTTSAASWRNVTINPGTELSLGSVLSSDLTSANITSIGFFVSTSAQSVARFDQLQVIPEPSTWALLAASLTALTVFRRRRHC